jgi:putative ABC transport system permease protein
MTMRAIRSLLVRIRSLLSRESRNADVSAELEFHLGREIEENLARGMSPEEAAAAARAEFGSLATTAEECYEARGSAWIDQLVQDCRFGTRSLIRHRSFAVVTILTLALGIGASAAVFSLADAVLFRSLPYNKPDQLAYIFTPSRQLLERGIPANVFTPSFADFSDLRRENHSFSSMTQYQQTNMNLAAGGAVQRVGAARVDAGFFRTLEVWPRIGRGLEESDQNPEGAHVAVISHAVWRNLFDGNRAALDGNVTLDGVRYRVVGVMPEGFEFPRTDDVPAGDGEYERTQIWVPMALSPSLATCRNWCGTFALGRLRSGVTRTAGQRELTAVMAHLDPLHQAPFKDLVANVEPLRNAVVGPVRLLMRLLLAAVGLVLLIASADAASLLLTRAAERTHELGVRAALGAQRERLLRQIMTESVLLCLGAAITGTGIAWLLLHGVRALHPGDIPRLQNAALNPRALGAIVAITVVLALLVGAAPSVLASRVNLRAFLASGGTRGVLSDRRRIRRTLAVTQIALVVVLLTGAGLLARSYLKVLASPNGYSLSTLSANLQFSARFDGAPANPRYDTPEKRRQFFADILGRLRHAPGVEAAGVVDVLPLTGAVLETNFEVEGHPAERNPMVEIRRVSPGWFASMRIPLLAGRDFAAMDGPESSAVVIVNRRFAATYLGGKRAIGQHIRLSSSDPWMTVVGVIGDARIYRPEDAPDLQIYISLWQADVSGGYLTLRSHLPELTAAGEIRTVVHSFDPDIAVADIHTLSDLESKATGRRRFQTTLMTSFSAMALVLALVGVYGLLAYSVKQRTAEIGIRMAMGSDRMGIVNLVLREGLALLAVGLFIGTAAALAVTRLLSGFLYGVPQLDPMTYAVVPCLLLLGTLAACVVPSMRAARIEPVHALRRE